jgi:hypothetical protein
MEQETASTTTPSVNPNTPRLTDIQVTDENVALNLLVSFINIAQKRGAFSIDESAKIWECIKVFQKPNLNASTVSNN